VKVYLEPYCAINALSPSRIIREPARQTELNTFLLVMSAGTKNTASGFV
jgi:hypothetical protein